MLMFCCFRHYALTLPRHGARHATALPREPLLLDTPCHFIFR
jgi:hypothetical protein